MAKECLDIASELMEDLEEYDAPEHIRDLAKTLHHEVEEWYMGNESEDEEVHENIYEENGKEDDNKNPDEEMNDGLDEVESFARDEVMKKTKPVMKLEIRAKK